MLQYPIPRACLPPLQSLSSFTLANWNPSSTQSWSGSSSVSLFCPTPFYHTPQLLYVINHTPGQANQIYNQVIYKSWYLIGQSRYLLKRWVFKSHFSFKVRQQGQEQLCLQFRVCWILYRMVRALSFLRRCLWIQRSLQSPPKIFFN